MEQARSDLVTHFRLDAKIFQDHTIIVKRLRHKRNARKEEKWVRPEKRPCGDGGFGQVWLEHEEADPSNVRAVKVIKKPQQGQNYQNQYERELWALAALSKHHDTVAEFFGWWEDEYELFLAMEYFPHRDLSNCIQTALPESEVKDITSQILEAVRILHSMDIIHRDLKPQNILVAERGPRWWVKIADFGISRRASQETEYTRHVGTSAFMAPEVAEEDPSQSYTKAVDIWAVGCIAYSLLTLRNLFADRRAARKYAKGKATIDSAWQILADAQVSQDGIEFLKTLTSPLAARRPTAAKALQSDWIESLRPASDDDSSESGDNLESQTFSSPFRLKSPFQPASFVTVADSGTSTGYRDESTIVSPLSGTSDTVRPGEAAVKPSAFESPPLPPRKSEQNTESDATPCSERCKCAICSGCSWNSVPLSSRAEYVMHSCGGGCFGGRSLCTNCLLRLDAGIYACPRCREVPEETYTRNRHQVSRPVGVSVGTSSDPGTSAKAPSPLPYRQSEPPKTKPKPERLVSEKTSTQTAASSTPLSQQPTLVAPHTQPSTTTEQKVPSLPTSRLGTALDELTKVIAGLAISNRCRSCDRAADADSWTCMACKDAGRAHRECLSCVPRLRAEYEEPSSGTLVRTCSVCQSLRCYLPAQSPSGAGNDGLTQAGGIFCTPSCKCDTCGDCSYKLTSHWKCGLCNRSRCATCANVPVSPVPWCSNASCGSEMLSLATLNRFVALAAPTTTTLLSILGRPRAQLGCIALGCSCSDCGACSLQQYTYRCVACVPGVTSATSKHVCQECVRKPLLLGEQPMCPVCAGVRFRAYSPRVQG